ncbi:MAG: PorZ beta-propeller-like domain-containing protein, partial [Flavisolibacter sp.]
MRLIFIFLIGFSFGASAQNTFPPIGSWREHLPYLTAIDVVASENKIYTATPYSLFSVDIISKEIKRISKISGLNETGISTISFDKVSKKLYIAYKNSNIDVLDEKGLYNIPELKRENISGDKSINQIYTDNNRTYLSTGLGIIVLDADKFEISASWFIGNTGGYVKTNAFIKNNGWYYAATDEGLKKISENHPNPADYHNWQLVSGTNGLSSAPAKQLDRLNGKTIVLQNDSLFVETGSTWNFFFANGWPITSIKSSENKLMISQSQSNSGAQVVALNESGSVQRIIQHPQTILSPAKAISVNNEIWIADA